MAASINNSSTGSGGGGHGADIFPVKLFRLLHDVEQGGLADLISWSNDGKSFKVHNKERFAKEIMPRYFSSSTYKSFQRSKNLWGFQTVSKGVNKGQCSHPLFVKHDINLCRKMVRVSVAAKNENNNNLTTTTAFGGGDGETTINSGGGSNITPPATVGSSTATNILAGGGAIGGQQGGNLFLGNLAGLNPSLLLAHHHHLNNSNSNSSNNNLHL